MATKSFSSVLVLSLCLATVQSSLIAQEKVINQPYYIFPREAGQHIDLSANWELSYEDSALTDVAKLSGKSVVVVKEPTSVQMALNKAGILPNPYEHKNTLLYSWVENKIWYYQKKFQLPLAAKGQSVLLCFDGLDYFSKVWVNGTLAGSHTGMFGGPTVNISNQVKYGEENSLVVETRAGNWGTERVPGIYPRTNVLTKIIRPRAASGESGLGPFYPLGMWQAARIEIVPAYHLERPFLKTLSVTDGEAKLHLSTEIFVNKNSTQFELHPATNVQINNQNASGISYVPITDKISIQIELLKGDAVAFSKIISATINEGRNWLEQDFTISNAMLWNPVGLGNPQLYRVRISLLKEQNQIDHIEFDYGIRRIDWVATAGPRSTDRWANWQMVVNGKKIFVKGMNWFPIDGFLDMPEERYRWALTAAKNMGVQLIRVWGGGILETNSFYKICNELGIMVWQEFPIANRETAEFPQDVWEEQVVQNIFHLRNHPSLVVWSGGNEFNPYTVGNTATIGILERNLKIFDDTRLFVRTSPDDGSMHAYPDMDPTWYNRSYKYIPFVSETGLHSIPEPSLFYELVDENEFKDLGKMWDTSFARTHREFIHHFAEYGPGRVPRMLSRASHIDDMANPSLEGISEATQIGAGEWYQIMSEKVQGNYPVTAGLMPWVFKRPWPAIAIQLMDWFGQPLAPYYFLKRTYEPTHVALDLPRLLWKAGEKMELKARITNVALPYPKSKISITVYDDRFKIVFKTDRVANVKAGTSITDIGLGSYTIPEHYKDKYLFIGVEMHDPLGKMISRSFYYPRVLAMMDDPGFYKKYIAEPIPWVSFNKGPWLKPTAASSPTTLSIKLLSSISTVDSTMEMQVQLKNTGNVPAFMTQLDVEGAKRIFYASDNYFWLSPGEERRVKITAQFREAVEQKEVTIKVSSLNSKGTSIGLNTKNIRVTKSISNPIK